MRREVLGIERQIGRLLLVDYNSPVAAKTESLMFVFAGGTISTSEIAQIRLQPEELQTYQFFAKGMLPNHMTASLQTRVQRAWQQISQYSTRYIENL